MSLSPGEIRYMEFRSVVVSPRLDNLKHRGQFLELGLRLAPSPQKTMSAHSLTHGAEPFLRSCHLCSYSRTSQHFMEPEGLLPCSQEPSTGPYPEPDQSTSYHPILSKIHLNIVHPPTFWSSQWSLSLAFPPTSSSKHYANEASGGCRMDNCYKDRECRMIYEI
jgi:hypothetical protein